MGMFDSFKVDADNVVNLPLPKDGAFQSKDLDCQLIEYRITKDGKLALVSEPSDGNKSYAVLLKDMGVNPDTAVSKIARGEFSGALRIYGEEHAPEKWEEYTLLLERNEILLVMNYDRVIYSRDPESTNDFLEAIDKACTSGPASLKQDIMFQQMMSTKHLLPGTNGPISDSYVDGLKGLDIKPDSRSASASLMTKERAEQAQERLAAEVRVRKQELLKQIRDSDDTYHLGSRMLSQKHLPQNQAEQNVEYRPRGTKHDFHPSMSKYFNVAVKVDENMDELIRRMPTSGISKLADGRYVHYKNPEVTLPPNHMVLMTHIDENEKDVLHLITHPGVVSVNDLMVIVTDQEGTVLEQHPTLWELQTARSSKAVQEGKENTFDLFVCGMMGEYGSTTLLYPHMILGVLHHRLGLEIAKNSHITPAGNIKPDWQKGK